MPKACFVKNCRSVWTPTTELSFHQFPMKNEKMMKEWMIARNHFRSTPTKNSTLCSNHFSLECFVQFSHKRTLKKNSIPTIFNDISHHNTISDTDGRDIGPDNREIKEEANDDILQDDISDWLHIKEENIEIEEFKMETSRKLCDAATQTEMNEKIENNIGILTKKFKLLRRCNKQKNIQLNQIAKIIKRRVYQRCRRYK